MLRYYWGIHWLQRKRSAAAARWMVHIYYVFIVASLSETALLWLWELQLRALLGLEPTARIDTARDHHGPPLHCLLQGILEGKSPPPLRALCDPVSLSGFLWPGDVTEQLLPSPQPKLMQWVELHSQLGVKSHFKLCFGLHLLLKELSG